MAFPNFTPVDPGNGWSAWDYARAMLQALQTLAANSEEEDSQGVTVHRRHPFVLTTDANGNADTRVFLPPGVSWTLLAYAAQIPFPGAPSGYLSFYQDSEEGTSLLRSSEGAAVISANFSPEGDRIPEQSALLIAARGFAPNIIVSGNIKAKGETDNVPQPTSAGGEFGG